MIDTRTHIFATMFGLAMSLGLFAVVASGLAGWLGYRVRNRSRRAPAAFLLIMSATPAGAILKSGHL